ncbi:MAG TPA: hypothetical protein VK665_04660 [Candidatus Elarobacter sp.]|nr:hypothetical protein [Candidatus Elarobacter sp.]
MVCDGGRAGFSFVRPVTPADTNLDPAKPVDPACGVTAEEASMLRDPIPELAIQEQIDAATSGVHAGGA